MVPKAGCRWCGIRSVFFSERSQYNRRYVKDLVGKLSVAELKVLVDLPRFSSLRALARNQGLTVTQVSKTIRSLEELAEREIVTRSPRGVALTEDGKWMSEVAAELVERISLLFDPRGAPRFGHERRLVVGSRGFLNIALAGPMVAYAESKRPETGWKFVDLSPNETTEAARISAIDLAILIDDLDLGPSWSIREAGMLSYGLFVRREHPIVRSPTQEELAKYRLFRGAYWDRSTVLDGVDLVPIPDELKTFGHQGQNAITAIAILLASDQIAFLPRLVVRSEVAKGTLRELDVEGTAEQSRPVKVAAQIDQVEQSLHSELVELVAMQL